MNLILLGAPGAGKGTQGALLAEHYDAARISTGDLLRVAVRKGTSLGQKAKSYIDAGELVPDDVILALMRELLTGEDAAAENGAIFDGFPRTVVQAEGLDALLRELDRPLDGVIQIEVPDDVLFKRLSGRRTCTGCSTVYNIYLEPPRVPGHCDVCGGTLIERADDDAATVRRRLEIYREQTAPLVAYYHSTDTPLHVVDGDRPVDDVQRSILRALGAPGQVRRSEARR